jgi:transcriptional regulator with XRE-family HTH domain
MVTIQKQLIKAIRASGQTRYQIAMGTGVAQSQLSRLFHGENNMTTKNIERIADYLGLELALRPKRRGTRKEN